jgi:hypothetical protein
MWDWANGQPGGTYNNSLGTPVPTGGIMYNGVDGGNSPNGNGQLFEEFPDSPSIEASEQCTITHRYRVNQNIGIQLQNQYVRGFVMTDSTGQLSRVLTTRLEPEGRTARQSYVLTIVSEAQSFSTPPDEFDITVVELNPIAEKHPRYPALTYSDKNAIRNAAVADFLDVQTQNIDFLQSLTGSLTSNLLGINNELAQATELLLKKQKGEETFYLNGYLMTYVKYYWSPQFINPGGYIEDPFSIVPNAFWTETNTKSNIFSRTTLSNQNLYPFPTISPPYGLSWLRHTDLMQLNRTWWKQTMSWVGAPLGLWDNEWYTPSFQPYQTNRYQGNVMGT